MRVTDLFDNYIFGELSSEERIDFENRLKTDLEFLSSFEKHKTLIEAVNQQEQRTHLKQILSTIHKQDFGSDAKIISLKEETFEPPPPNFPVMSRELVFGVHKLTSRLLLMLDHTKIIQGINDSKKQALIN